MAKRKKKQKGPADQIREIMYSPYVPGETKLMIGLGALLFGFVTLKFAPKYAPLVIPEIMSGFTPPGCGTVAVHPESLEPVTTHIDERQLGRSEVIRELSRDRAN